MTHVCILLPQTYWIIWINHFITCSSFLLHKTFLLFSYINNHAARRYCKCKLEIDTIDSANKKLCEIAIEQLDCAILDNLKYLVFVAVYWGTINWYRHFTLLSNFGAWKHPKSADVQRLIRSVDSGKFTCTQAQVCTKPGLRSVKMYSILGIVKCSNGIVNIVNNNQTPRLDGFTLLTRTYAPGSLW